MVAIAAITGHRPEAIDYFWWVEEALSGSFSVLGVNKVIQGMAAGVDLRSAKVAYQCHIPYIAARPWAGHKPRKADEKEYEKVLSRACRVVNVDPSLDYPGVWVYQKRNEWMVDHCDFVVSVWNGVESGGTWNCIKYARKLGVDVFNCNPVKRTCDFLAPRSV